MKTILMGDYKMDTDEIRDRTEVGYCCELINKLHIITDGFIVTAGYGQMRVVRGKEDYTYLSPKQVRELLQKRKMAIEFEYTSEVKQILEAQVLCEKLMASNNREEEAEE